MTIQCIIIPKKFRSISNILPNNKKIIERIELKLNEKEIRTCMNDSSVIAIMKDGRKVNIDEKNWHSTIEANMDIVPKPDEKYIAKVGYGMVGLSGVM